MLDSQIDEWEHDAFSKPDSLERRRITELCSEVRKLRHELADPNFQYAGSRIHRHAVMCRDGEREQLRDEVFELRKKLAELSPQQSGA